MEISINIVSCAIAELKPGKWSISHPRRPYWRLYWVDRPGASVSDGTSTTPLLPNAVVLVAPNTDFTGSVVRQVRQVYIHFVCDALFDTSSLSIISIQSPNWLEDIHGLCEHRQTGRILSDSVLPACLKLVTSSLAEIPVAHIRGRSIDEQMLRIERIMRTHHSPVLSNDDLSALANMSKRAFLRAFKESYGQSPQTYYLHLRLIQALIDLETSRDSIDAIAANRGFCDRNYFSAVFRKHYSTSPAAYRRDNSCY